MTPVEIDPRPQLEKRKNQIENKQAYLRKQYEHVDAVREITYIREYATKLYATRKYNSKVIPILSL